MMTNHNPLPTAQAHTCSVPSPSSEPWKLLRDLANQFEPEPLWFFWLGSALRPHQARTGKDQARTTLSYAMATLDWKSSIGFSEILPKIDLTRIPRRNAVMTMAATVKQQQWKQQLQLQWQPEAAQEWKWQWQQQQQSVALEIVAAAAGGAMIVTAA